MTAHEAGPEGPVAGAAPAMRIDRWLWCARFFKSRTLAARICTGGRVRVNRAVVSKAHHNVRAGDVLTFAQGERIRVVRVLAIAERRGPAAEAALLYEDLSPEPPSGRPAAGERAAVPLRDPGSGRPTKAARRAIDRLRDPDGRR